MIIFTTKRSSKNDPTSDGDWWTFTEKWLIRSKIKYSIYKMRSTFSFTLWNQISIIHTIHFQSGMWTWSTLWAKKLDLMNAKNQRLHAVFLNDS